MIGGAGEASGRPIDTLLFGYAAGTLAPPLHALIGSHLELSDENRAFVADLEGMAASEIALDSPVPIAGRERMLQAIFAAGEGSHPVEPPADPIFPHALRRHIGLGSHEIPWRFKLPGLKEYRIAESEAGEAVLYWVRPGRKLPQHTHEGLEATLLLRGGFSDVTGHYRRGDVSVGDADLDHQPVADDDEDCLCFVVTDAPLVLTGPVMKLLRRFTGR